MMIRFNNVTKQFSEQYVLREFSFDIKEGDKVNVSGRSGIGKTTLFKLLLGFETPDKGELFYQNKPLDENSVWELRKEVAYVSQDLNIGNGSVRSLFEETMSLKANQKFIATYQKELDEHLAFFELPQSILDKDVDDLSGGEKQRIAIINALLLGRKLFFLDEITSALDKALKEKVLTFFLSKPEFTVLYISHDNYLPESVDIKTIKL